VELEDGLILGILETARTVHETLGPGFIESIYARALVVELRNKDVRVQREKTIRISYSGTVVGKHRLDLVIDDAVIVELKATRTIIPIHICQMHSYLHACGYRFGLILNFGVAKLHAYSGASHPPIPSGSHPPFREQVIQ